MTTENKFPDLNRYKLISKIGEGAFSKVYRVKDSETNIYYAAKVANLVVDEDSVDSQDSRLLFREVNLISMLNHPAVLKFVGYYQTDFENEPKPTIVTELATRGSLKDVIEMEISSISPYDWNDTKKLINIYGIASGLAFLHENSIIHRDLKPENILMDENLHPKISDFGLSKMTDFLSVSMNFNSQKGLKGTPLYMAPEMLAEEIYSEYTDVYAFSFIVYEIMSAEIPFLDFNFAQIMKKVVLQGHRPVIKDYVPYAYKQLIEKC